MYDGVVLMDVNIVDASGNSASFNQLAFTGSDVNENVEGMRVSPEAMVLTNALDRQTLNTYVDFEFHGEVQLNTTTSGLSYASSDTSKVIVSSSGVLYPIEETTDAPVYITVSYSGAPSVQVPVNVDYSKIITEFSAVESTLTVPSLYSKGSES